MHGPMNIILTDKLFSKPVHPLCSSYKDTEGDGPSYHGYTAASYRKVWGSIPGHSEGDLLWTKCH